MKTVVLASQSPRRKELLTQAGIEFTVQPSVKEEIYDPAETPDNIVASLALQKAEEVFAQHPEAVVIGSDTMVAIDGKMLGKPKDEEEAARMLKQLSGRTHQVHTGAAILSKEDRTVFTETVQVTFYPLTESEINTYIQSKEPADKAGAYGIQGLGAVLVERIEGDYFSIVGLPVAKVVRALKKHGIQL
ncbi:Maf family protein [Alkalicoccus daliensis]|uniref:dTTP/UTP pyrophosphatase n=1 Tax=Alkalicoccus daliensis TaxID=745820 RepID=A0A1H0CMG7_9BACI|nr:Maf family protein [Alkalicoccus daliensis]SDN59079.1 septum formation protein [Alkalicoccus daliensis]